MSTPAMDAAEFQACSYEHAAPGGHDRPDARAARIFRDRQAVLGRTGLHARVTVGADGIV